MKKITLSLFLFLAIAMGSHAQVTIGEGTNQGQHVPFEPYYGYTYAQSIYLASEINASGNITKLQWYYSGTSNLSNNQNLVIYFGQTDKTEFDSETDFVAVEEMTQVYAGGITVTAGVPGWVTLTLDTPFAYNGTSNLVIAVDENMGDYNSSGDDFYNTAVNGQRSIYSYSDVFNTDPSDPATDPEEDAPNRGTAAFVPNIILGGIQQACANPSGISASGITTTATTFNWVAATGQTDWEVLVLEEGSETPDNTTTGTPVTGTPTYTITTLTENTPYQVYVRAKCSATLYSGWSGPINFRTQCLSFEDFIEDFDTTAYNEIPNCWNIKNITTSMYTTLATIDYGAASGSNCFQLYNDEDGNAQMYLITPGLTSIGANTHRIKFKAKGGNSGYSIIVGTMTDPGNAATFTALQTIQLTDSYSDYSVSLNTSTTDNYVAFKHGLGGTYRSIYLDDILWEPIPSVVPDCISDLNATINDECGNFATVLEWSAVDGADGYKISIGTIAGGGGLIVNNVDLNSALNYTFEGNANTTYYYNVIPYNALGPATGCVETSFVTAADGCYCTSQPTSNDGLGITNVQINNTSFANDDVTYFDYTGDGAVNLARGVNAVLNISFATGFTYGTNIWIDFNDNYTFEASEIVFSGESTNINPTNFNATFLMSLTAALGEHRMRIGTADSGQSTPNPCYSNNYGVTLDFLVNITEVPACLPPTTTSVTAITANTAQLNWVSAGATFNVEYGEIGFEQGSGTVVNGITANTLAVSSLTSQTDYGYYIQTDCGAGSLSPWTGPYLFRTACDAFDDFEENFTTNSTMPAPECWYTLKSSTSQYSYITMYSFNDNIEMYNSDDEAAALYLITPSLTSLPLATHRVKFKAFSYSEGVSVIVGTMSDPAVASSFTAVQTIPVSDDGTPNEYSVPFSTATTNQYVAFKFIGTDSYQSLIIDDVIWEPTPTVAPECVTDINVETNPDCGNYASNITWTAAEGADFYTLTIGTASGQGTPVNIGNVTSYSFTGNFNTTYYYTLVPGNNFGSASGCTEGTFTTSTTGCYCTSVPTSNDNLGITNVSINTSAFENGDYTYTDFTGEGNVTLQQGVEAAVQITFVTGYSYDTNIWIDYNDNYVFEASEIVFSGEAPEPEDENDDTVVFDAPFTPAPTAALGVHRMRIGSADSGQYDPDPCYSDTYGVTLDFNVLVEENLSTQGFKNDAFSAYPNPVKDVLNLSYTQNITNVAVFNLLGQQVITKTLNASQGQLDMSNLSKGTYFVKVTADNQVKTIKVIKQ